MEKIQSIKSGKTTNKVEEIIKDINHHLKKQGGKDKIFSIEAVGSSLKITQHDDGNDWKELTAKNGMLFTGGLVGNNADAIIVLIP